MTRLVVGVDPSYTRTGLATPGDTRSLVPPTVMADLPPGARASRRRAWLVAQTLPVIRQADVVAIEGMYPTTERGAIDRAGLLAVLTDAARAHSDTAVVHIAPASVKIYATGNGQSPKSALAHAFGQHHLYGAASGIRTPANDDEIDAWFIAALVSDLLGRPLLDLPPHHRRALDPYRPPYTRRHPSPWVRGGPG